MNWIKMADRQPTEKDFPFLAYFVDERIVQFNREPVIMSEDIEMWDDMDWFFELSEEERIQRTHWIPITKPE